MLTLVIDVVKWHEVHVSNSAWHPARLNVLSIGVEVGAAETEIYDIGKRLIWHTESLNITLPYSTHKQRLLNTALRLILTSSGII